MMSLIQKSTVKEEKLMPQDTDKLEVTPKFKDCLKKEWSCALIRFTMFVANGITFNIASFLLLLGAVMFMCPCLALFPSLINFDIRNLQFLGLRQLLNVETVDLHQDIRFLTENFTNDVRLIGIVVFFFAFTLYFISIAGCFCSALNTKKGTELYTLICAFTLMSLIFTSVYYLNPSRMENSDLVKRAKSYIKNDYTATFIGSSFDDNIVDFLQSRLGCCGISNGSDYWKIAKMKVPPSCCKMLRLNSVRSSPVFFNSFSTCPEYASASNSYINVGCFNRIYAYVNDTIGRVTFVFWILCFVGLSSCLVTNLSSKTLKNMALDEKLVFNF